MQATSKIHMHKKRICHPLIQQGYYRHKVTGWGSQADGLPGLCTRGGKKQGIHMQAMQECQLHSPPYDTTRLDWHKVQWRMGNVYAEERERTS